LVGASSSRQLFTTSALQLHNAEAAAGCTKKMTSRASASGIGQSAASGTFVILQNTINLSLQTYNASFVGLFASASSRKQLKLCVQCTCLPASAYTNTNL
jgi:hypothetical protein